MLSWKGELKRLIGDEAGSDPDDRVSEQEACPTSAMRTVIIILQNLGIRTFQ